MSESVTVNDDGTATVIVTDETVTVVSDLTTGAAALAAHELDADPHPQYTTAAEAAAAAPVQSVAGHTGIVTLSQADIAGLLTSDSPSFVSLTLSGLTASRLLATDANKLLTSTVSGLSPTFTGLTLSGLTANRFLVSGSGGAIETAAAITAGRVIFADADGKPTGASGFTYSTSTGLVVTSSAGSGIVGTITSQYGTTTVGRGGTGLSFSSGILSQNFLHVDTGGGNPCGIATVGSNSLMFASDASASYIAGKQTSRTEINKAVTAFSNGVGKAVLTFTIPNAAHSASFLIRVVGSLGAGGSVGANEATQTATYQVDVTRTAGKNAVATISAVYPQAASATVSGGQNIATTAALGAVSGGTTATNTFTVEATLTRAGSGADNHTALVHCSLLNANTTGVTVA